MNRKKTAKTNKALAKLSSRVSPYDNVLSWMKGDLPCPWTKEQIADFQLKIDSAFGAKDALVLAWSMDRDYWDEIYMDDWHIHGAPKGRPQKIPMLLFKHIPVNERDYLMVSAPRWMILEKLHGSQLEDSWDESSWVADNESIGGKKRIRTEKPPVSFYQPLLPPLGTIAEHVQNVVTGEINPCCRTLMANDMVCYGRYREPGEDILAEIRKIRERMDRDGVAQRSDQPRSLKTLERQRMSTNFLIQEAAKRQREATQELILANPMMYMGDVMANYGITKTAPEIDRILKEAFRQSNEEQL